MIPCRQINGLASSCSNQGPTMTLSSAQCISYLFNLQVKNFYVQIQHD